MVTVLLRAVRSRQIALIQVASWHSRGMLEGNGNCLGFRQMSIFSEFSKQLKGETKSNPEFQQSVKALNEKLLNAKEDLKVRTKNTTEKLYKSVDGVWSEAEARSNKVSANLSQKFSAAKEKVSTNVRDKLSAAKEQVKVTFGLGKESSYSSESSTKNFEAKDGGSFTNGAETQSSESERSKESSGQTGTLFEKLRSSLTSASPIFSGTFQKMGTKISEFSQKGYEIVKEELTSSPSKRKRLQYTEAAASSGPRSTRTDIVVMPSKQSPLGAEWEAFRKKMQEHPMYKRMSGFSKPVVTKGQEFVEDMRERLETSDNPVVHKIQDLNDTVFGETATALSTKEIRRRDPTFSLPDFVADVQEMVKPVLTAYAKCDEKTLKKYCYNELIERCKAERTGYQSQGIFFDNKMLHVSDIDVRESKIFESSPVIVIGFQTQEIYCVRDREGSVTAGGKDTIHMVRHLWAMQLMGIEELGEEALYPIWKVREMHKFGFQALI